MGVYYNTEIPNEGLLLYVDAANKRSYPGSGTTWYDLSGNSRNGTLTGSPTWSSNNGGIFQFNGSNYIQFNNINLATSQYSVIGAARYSGGTRGRMITSISNNWLLGHWGTTTENHYAEGWVTSSSSGANDTNWRILAATGDIVGDVWNMYVNGTNTFTNSNGSAGPNGLQVPQAGGEQSIGECAFILVYDRPLFAVEMQQIFRTFRGRFSI